jgi:TonB family protein
MAGNQKEGTAKAEATADLQPKPPSAAKPPEPSQQSSQPSSHQVWSGPSRRRVPRFALQAPLDVTILRSGVPDTVPGRSLNVGERGLAAMLAGELEPGETVGVEMRLPLIADPLRTRAMVRYQDQLRCGLEFVGLSADQRASIRDWAKDARAMDPEVHLSAISGIAKLPEGAKTAEKTSGQIAEKPAPKSSTPSARSGDKGSAAAARIIPTSRAPAQKRHGPLWIAFLAIGAIAVAGFWWQWNRAWTSLESGLKTNPTAAAEKPEAQVSAEVMERLIIHRVEPKYPPEARQQGLQGVIALDVIVGRDGSVVSMRPLNGPDILAQAAMDALRWWRFEPYRINGEPAIVETTVAVEFKR